mmetsp:Transcript_23892/g.39505  ORF Transcript_23892/g.39505 Transcript_23892/m.39505 type:complete len:518 (-) Transcript_23892:114-1667(-)
MIVGTAAGRFWIMASLLSISISSSSSSVSVSASASASANLVSSSKSRLPMSLSSVISDLEAEGASAVTRACLVTSSGVTRAQRAAVLDSMFGLERSGDTGGDDSLTAFGTHAEGSDSGLAIANPSPQASAADVASTVVACGGTVIFSPSPIDLSRGEGLFDALAPAMERLLSSSSTESSSLIVVASNPELARQQLQEAASSILPHLIQPRGKRPAQVLEDIFASVTYVSSPQDVVAKLASIQACAPSDAASAIAATVDFFAPAAATALSSKDLAAARTVGPAARTALESALAAMQEAVASSAGGLVSNFGDVADAQVKKAMQDVSRAEQAGVTSTGQQITAQLKEELYSEMSDLFHDQLEALTVATFEAFRKDLSQLRISPTLANDMDDVVQKSLVNFAKAAKQLIAKGATWSAVPAKTAFSSQLKEFCSERLLVAKASGQFRPFPRKGYTIGMHWLLPKPFGNDFRQEPWMVHATDNMVYVPEDKITNVAPGDIKNGDWRSKIVPSPSSREMVYVQ